MSFRRVYDFLARFLTTGMRFLLNKQVGYLSVPDLSVFVSCLSVCFPPVSVSDLSASVPCISVRSVQLWITLPWSMSTRCWTRSLWGQRLINTLGLIIPSLMIQWFHPGVWTCTSGWDSDGCLDMTERWDRHQPSVFVSRGCSMTCLSRTPRW